MDGGGRSKVTEGGRLPRFVWVYNYNMYSRGLSCELYLTLLQNHHQKMEGNNYLI